MWLGSAPPLATGFIQRTALEHEVREALAPGAAVTLVADGSRGKTQLALSVASSMDADLRIWVSATSRAAVLSVFAEAAANVGCAPAQFPAWLRETARSWITVFDDITEDPDLTGLLPSGRSGRVLVTSANVIPGTRPVTVGGFTRHESMAYLMGRLTADLDQRQGAADLVTELGDEPLALAQATAVIASSELTCRDYRQHYLRESARLGSFPEEATWALSVEHADVLAPGAAQSLLAIAALLDRHAIPVAVLPGHAALDSASQAGLVAVDGSFARMASQVQDGIRTATPDGMLKSATLDAADALLREWPDDDQPEWLTRSLRSCADSLRRASGGLLWQGGCHQVLLRAGYSMDSAGLGDAAVSWWSDLAGTALRELGPSHPDAITIRERLAAAQLAAGRFSDAISAFTEKIAEAEREHGPGSHQALAAREELAAAHRAMGGLSDAITLYRRVVADRERTQGSKHPDTLATCQRLADTHLEDGRPKVAISMLKRVLSDRERVLGAGHTDTLATRSSLAAAYHSAGKMASAVQLYEQARDGYAKALGPDHRETLVSCVRLAHAYYGVGRLGDVTRLLRETLARSEAVLPASDPLIPTVRESLANIGG